MQSHGITDGNVGLCCQINYNTVAQRTTPFIAIPRYCRIETYQTMALLKLFRILAYFALIEVRDNVWGYKQRVSTEPKPYEIGQQNRNMTV